jgi:hypothetical protein
VETDQLADLIEGMRGGVLAPERIAAGMEEEMQQQMPGAVDTVSVYFLALLKVFNGPFLFLLVVR